MLKIAMVSRFPMGQILGSARTFSRALGDFHHGEAVAANPFFLVTGATAIDSAAPYNEGVGTVVSYDVEMTFI